MSLRKLIGLSVLVVVTSSPVAAGEDLPFRGAWEGSTDSATPLGPDVVLVVSSGSGEATRLGRFEMTSPHLTFLSTFEVEGEQNFTAANGDQLFAVFSGQFLPNPDGTLESTLEAIIIGGTGRFRHASGGYDFHIVARPAAFGFDSTATFRGTIRLRGAD